jgi:uncharacterized protein YydD (DUF2326 family)
MLLQVDRNASAIMKSDLQRINDELVYLRNQISDLSSESSSSSSTSSSGAGISNADLQTILNKIQNNANNLADIAEKISKLQLFSDDLKIQIDNNNLINLIGLEK